MKLLLLATTADTRRKVFPNYKQCKKTREDSAHDWNTIFDVLGQVKAELDEFMPYPVIDVDGAEQMMSLAHSLSIVS